MPRQHLQVDCSARVPVPVLDEQGEPVLIGGVPVHTLEAPQGVLMDMTPEEEAAIAAAQEEAAVWAQAAQAARNKRAADLALLAASPDEHHQALARLLAGG